MTIKQAVQTAALLLIIATFAFTGCKKDVLNTSSSFKLEFSNDTVMFDTVFTSIGSSTRSLVIRNTGSERVNISKITLARGTSSPFRLNIDGTATEDYKDLEIAAHDSAYIFVKVTIDPNNISNPFIQSDSIVFETNGNVQNVKLVAWGQNAYFYKDKVLTGDVTLPDDKPHVIYGTLKAASGCNLKITAGTRLYFHNGGSFEIRKGASLNVYGTVENPVTFTSDRLDLDYRGLPGLWLGIWLENGSRHNSFSNAEITNARVGIQADSCGLAEGDTLRLHNCLINNMTNYGLKATKARIFATNCQITNCGANVVSIELGGMYDFRNCTLARYFGGRGYPALSIGNYVFDTLGNKLPGALTSAYFGNCIVTGNLNADIDFYELDGTAFNFQFDYCLATWDKDAYKKYASRFTHCIVNTDLRFMDPFKNNFQLDSLSHAIDSASLDIINLWHPDLLHDRKGVSRLEHGLPDIGAYEKVFKR